MADLELLPTAIRAALSSQSQSQGDSALLHGPAGCGKTRFARSLNSSSLAGIDVRWLDAQKIAAAASRRVGGAEAELAAQLDAAKRNAPCVFIIDELEALAPSDAMPGSVEVRLALQLAEGIEELQALLTSAAAFAAVSRNRAHSASATLIALSLTLTFALFSLSFNSARRSASVASCSSCSACFFSSTALR